MNTTETKIQTAARVAGDAILAGDPGAVFNRRARRDQALALLDDWQANGLPAGAWKLDKAKVITRMRRLVSLPHTLNQGYLDSCNYVCILYLCLLRFPVETVTAARNLYERGVAELGGLQLRPEAFKDSQIERSVRRDVELSGFACVDLAVKFEIGSLAQQPHMVEVENLVGVRPAHRERVPERISAAGPRHFRQTDPDAGDLA